eukprot:2307223-Pleurochrysis_carterae.AAC.1
MQAHSSELTQTFTRTNSIHENVGAQPSLLLPDPTAPADSCGLMQAHMSTSGHGNHRSARREAKAPDARAPRRPECARRLTTALVRQDKPRSGTCKISILAYSSIRSEPLSK